MPSLVLLALLAEGILVQMDADTVGGISAAGDTLAGVRIPNAWGSFLRESTSAWADNTVVDPSEYTPEDKARLRMVGMLEEMLLGGLRNPYRVQFLGVRVLRLIHALSLVLPVIAALPPLVPLPLGVVLDHSLHRSPDDRPRSRLATPRLTTPRPPSFPPLPPPLNPLVTPRHHRLNSGSQYGLLVRSR